MNTLFDDIERAINRHSAESASNTPDYVLARFLVKTLAAFDHATNTRALHMAGSTKATTPPEVTQAMVDRFLTWRLPADFAPDSGIAFEGRNRDPRGHQWPTGTNLLHAGQARAMLEHVLGAADANIAPPDDGTDGAVALCQHLDRVGRTSSERIITINGGTFIVKAELVHRAPQTDPEEGEIIAGLAPDTRPKTSQAATATGETAADKQTAHQLPPEYVEIRRAYGGMGIDASEQWVRLKVESSQDWNRGVLVVRDGMDLRAVRMGLNCRRADAPPVQHHPV